MQTSMNYFLLFIVITCGVVAGNVISNLIVSGQTAEEIAAQPSSEPKVSTDISTPSIEQEMKEDDEKDTKLRETIKLSPDNSNESKITESPINSEELIEQRKLDENGIRLAKQCSEWTVVHKDMQTKTSEAGMNKYCDQYYDYVSFGTLPEAK